MIADFQKVFHPTEQDKEESVKNYLNVLVKLIDTKNCCTCKHSKIVAVYIHGYETTDTYCKLKDEVGCISCDDYEVCNIEELLIKCLQKN